MWGVHEVLEQWLQSELISPDSAKGKHSTLPLGTLSVGKPKSQIKSNSVELITLNWERGHLWPCPRSLYFKSIYWTFFILDILVLFFIFHREQKVDWEIHHYFEMASNLPEGNSFASNSLSQWSLKIETEGWDILLESAFFPLFFLLFLLPLPLFFSPTLHSFIHLTSSYSILHGRSLEERMDLKLMYQAKGRVPWCDYLPSILVSSHKKASDKPSMGRLEKGWRVYPWPCSLQKKKKKNQRKFDFLFLMTSWIGLNGH